MGYKIFIRFGVERRCCSTFKRLFNSKEYPIIYDHCQWTNCDEAYFNGHTPNATWQSNSAGKTLVGTTTLIALLRALFEKSINHHKDIEWTEGQF
jgi:hypothetical protein